MEFKLCIFFIALSNLLLIFRQCAFTPFPCFALTIPTQLCLLRYPCQPPDSTTCPHYTLSHCSYSCSCSSVIAHSSARSVGSLKIFSTSCLWMWGMFRPQDESPGILQPMNPTHLCLVDAIKHVLVAGTIGVLARGCTRGSVIL